MSPFAEGYIKAARDSLPPEQRHAPLADETLALILKDCAAVTPFYADHHGLDFWTERQQGEHQPDFPPQTVTLGDDGKIYLKSTGR